MRMASGAGHDAMYMANRYPTAMLFVPSREGISHHPAEYTEPQDIALAAQVLRNTLARLANV
ncbi:M20/M25/M40 family metallo-hydrolase [Candidatus Symbiopectobacterium sp. 'North America']|uniref:M20/M25/M40 family metallo-hydrolase n=1 Tax=Candidatus Symbiopectobacterium sp. 'North America' TaxID=2794574 RepID=UPI001FD02F48|nr:M20/M25/M40 family metallo-hydrolase [Candidatus Symbiopectobacterium sp. 'North America']